MSFAIPDEVLALEGHVGHDHALDASVLDIQQVGTNGEYRMRRVKDHQAYRPVTNLPLGLGEDYLFPHDLTKELEAEFLTPPRTLPSNVVTAAQALHVDALPPLAFLQLDAIPTALGVELERDVFTGEVIGVHETITDAAGMTAKNSSSFQRDLAPARRFVRGQAGNVPFTPGGLDDVQIQPAATMHLADLLVDGQLLTAAPGLDRGLVMHDDEDAGRDDAVDWVQLMTRGQDEEMDVMEQLMAEQTIDDHVAEVELPAAPAATDDAVSTTTADENGEDLAILDVELDTPGATTTASARAAAAAADLAVTKREWAHMVTDPMTHFHTLVPDMAHKYPFELDVFQKQAVYHLERGDSVFVAAHTSAGKTVVAEYAIALAQRHMTRAIYTSPIKALSNQKFRDFTATFQDVGILTGDVQINPEANCLIMTTEILRSMLYKGADLIRDVEFVIFDEVHYVNDMERGVVWEEVIIMLPAHVQLILLSATVPNTREFADWVGRTKKRDIYVVSTLYRPVPLEHYLYVPSAKEYFKIVDSKKTLLQQGLRKAMDHLLGIANAPPGGKKRDLPSLTRGGPRGGARGGGATGSNRPAKAVASKTPSTQRLDRTTWTQLIGVLQKRDLLPVVVFTFSKKKCEEYADCMSSVDLLSAAEKSDVHVFMERSLLRLRGDDRQLPQILRMREMLSRGVAVHHGGLLPLVKEMVEILFSRGLVKVLHATETFAMGVNMPTKCVVFSSTRKHDGRSFRDLLPGEYTQMSGRAGRRGLDSTGAVFIMALDTPDVAGIQMMILGPPTKLASQFRLTYNMILNLLRVETLQVEEMMKRSFSENASQKMLPETEKAFAAHQATLQALPPIQCLLCAHDLAAFYETCAKILQLGYDTADMILGSPVGAKALAAGRVVVINNSLHRNAVAVSLTPQRSTTKTKGQLLVFVLVDRARGANVITGDDVDAAPLPVTRVQVPTADNADGKVVTVPMGDVALVTNAMVPVNADEVLKNKVERALVTQELRRYAERTVADGLVEYDWSKLRDLEFQIKYRERRTLMTSLKGFRCMNCPDLIAHYARMHQERQLQSKLMELQQSLTAQNLDLLPEYHQRLDVLKDLGYVDARTGTVQLKGRVACEINSADELLLTELVLNNFFADLDVPETVAVLSVFLFQEKSANDEDVARAMAQSDAEPDGIDGADGVDEVEKLRQSSITDRWPARLVRALRTVRNTARTVVAVQEALGVPVKPETYLKEKLRYGLVEVAYEWARGMSFKQIMGLTDVLEGSIVRCIIRLEET
ncbi:hypothetical protein GGF32_002946, partial [Allomyces javanicus]